MTKNPTKVVAYMRVSTARQGKSGLGLEAQRAAIATFCAQHGLTLAGEFTEVQTGKGHDALERRPILKEALEVARKAKAALVVAKLDRLARDVAFISRLMAEGTDFRVADLGLDAEPFMIHIYASLAQKEREMISARTRSALQAVKAKGKQLGSKNILEVATIGRQMHSEQARKAVAPIKMVISDIEAAGVRKLSDIAKALEARGIRTPTGKAHWHAKQVSRLLAA